MLEDENGFIWLGTSNGLYQFDGFEFKHFVFPDYDNEYSNIKIDELGRIWFSNFGGQLFYYVRDSLHLVIENTIDNNYVYNYEVVGLNKVLYHTINAPYLVESDTLGVQQKAIEFSNKQSIATSIFEKDDLKLFVEEDFSEFRLVKMLDVNQVNNEITILDSVLLPIKSSKKYAQHLDKNTYVYIQHHDELEITHFTKNKAPKIYYSAEINSKSLNNYKVIDGELVLLGTKESYFVDFYADNKIRFNAFSSLKNVSNVLLDNERNLWISTINNGVFIAANTDFVNYAISPFEAIKQVKVLNDSTVFYVTDEGKLYQLDLKTKKAQYIPNSNINPNFKIDINPFTNNLLIPGNKRYYDIDKKKWVYKNESNFFKDIHFLDAENAIITLNTTDLLTFKKDFNIEDVDYKFKNIKVEENDDFSLFTVAKGRSNLIIEENNKQHLYVNQINGIIHYSTEKEPDTLVYKGKPVIASALINSSSSVWISDIAGYIHQVQFGNIINSYPFKERVEHLAVIDSLIFIQTSNNIYRLNNENKQLLKIDNTDGLSNETLVNISLTDSSLFVWGTNTLQELSLKYSFINKVPPKLFISKMLVNDKEVDFLTKHIFSHDQNNIEFYFRSISTRSQKNRRYFYRIKELNDKWETTNFEVPYVRYAQLASGNYTFQVKVENEDGYFSKIKEISFKIDKHFTKKWWFILSIVALVGLLVYSIVAFRIKILNKQAQLKQEKESLQKDVYKARISAIHAQMNPHFIFNALNSIQTLVLRGDIDNTYTYINKFAGLIRQTLNFSENDYVPIDSEINLLETYLNLEKLRFRNDFNYEIVQNNLPSILVPPMLIQPFVENALKHGLLHLPTNRKIKLTFYFEDVLVCVVEDNGIGRKASAEINKRRNKDHKSFAISALQQRFEILQVKFKYKIGFTYFDLEENGEAKGTKVIIKIPFKYNS